MSLSRPRKIFAFAMVVMVGCGAFAVLRWIPPPIWGQIRPVSYEELSSFPDSDLARVDIALMNLLCAEGLPGSEGLNLRNCLETLDHWAVLVKQSEKKYFAQYDQNPERYDSSVAKFKAVNLALTLKQDIGCGYNKDLAASGAMADIHSTRFFRNSGDLFLHGFIENRKGRCSSLPVLMVAIGRRCGYPLFLVPCKRHLFCRWDDGKDRFNIETACEGMDIKPDSHYRQWPYPFEDAEAQSEKYLKSLTPAEEFGVFSEMRATCLQENRRFEEAARSYEIALRSFPNSKLTRTYLNNVKGGK